MRLQELSKISIEAGQGNATTILHHLVDSLREEYGIQHVNAIEPGKWFFK